LQLGWTCHSVRNAQMAWKGSRGGLGGPGMQETAGDGGRDGDARSYRCLFHVLRGLLPLGHLACIRAVRLRHLQGRCRPLRHGQVGEEGGVKECGVGSDVVGAPAHCVLAGGVRQGSSSSMLASAPKRSQDAGVSTRRTENAQALAHDTPRLPHEGPRDRAAHPSWRASLWIATRSHLTSFGGKALACPVGRPRAALSPSCPVLDATSKICVAPAAAVVVPVELALR